MIRFFGVPDPPGLAQVDPPQLGFDDDRHDSPLKKQQKATKDFWSALVIEAVLKLLSTFLTRKASRRQGRGARCSRPPILYFPRWRRISPMHPPRSARIRQPGRRTTL